MMNGFILQENTSILINRNGKTLYSILHRSLDLTYNSINPFVFKLAIHIHSTLVIQMLLLILNLSFYSFYLRLDKTKPYN